MAGRKIAVAIDDSDHSKNALKWYLDNIAREGDEVVLVHCAEFSYNFFLPGAAVDVEAVTQQAKKQNDEIDLMMNSCTDMVRGRGQVKSRMKVLSGGKPGDMIVKFAEEEHPNMIIVGSRGLGKIRRTFLGSVSEYIVHHAPPQSSVTIVRDS